MYIILVYDIALDQNGAKVLRHVFKICKKYLSHVQKSVFEGELTKSQLQKLTTELDKWVRNDKDSIIIFKNRNKNWLDKKFIGLDMSDETSNFF
ncbi:MAG: CRISPR-associated endonuclease Cas2 [Liquorilactobacillus nagelii]|uniref:CRISPR-associated endoribonuclease Cas2 n=1 Tax=Liquorilactobacillus nagelii TaxID=82688 RepID=A0A3Q8CMV2_9LACO|nr:CRISPR-associated endonuclease Cas2 [Liquorilactobacillus nagelii]AUJ32820.1 CRISPR-associated endonuclease Cas2 [Liquorilactobacillus nagelii]MCC7616437.1 CRISPR-associated endonuclease Cas2 [Liquorilactobacillus nagelii]MCI1699756.1 CRISPR-associated endonuclease Cas2 [Liquorilactobacillus nagelii]MCP9315195.1 CRISPR-associated endonuclease Cas2 [Liquorilactobacillus nagelii]QYH55262.1 CRISPR-associated endonuclease Cas2 [Liquorilactobacillus nagelii DSM 13675]